MKQIHLLALLLFVVSFAYAEENTLVIDSIPLDTIQGEEVYKYQVEKGMGLYRIGVNFKVNQEEIIRLNPQLQSQGLRFGEMLYIPTKRAITQKVEEIKEDVIQKAQKIKEDATQKVQEIKEEISPIIESANAISSTIQTFDSLDFFTDTIGDRQKVIDLALMLPFESKQTKRSVQATRMMEFYQGALLALYKAQNDSILFRLRVFDTERSERRIIELMNSEALNDVDGILGPAYTIQVEQLLPWCEKNQVPLLLPFNDDADLKGHPYLYQFNASDNQKAITFTNWIKSKGDSIHCVVLDTDEIDISQSARAIRAHLRYNQVPYTKTTIHDMMNDSLCFFLDSTKQNLIILHTDKYSRANILIPYIEKCMKTGYDISLYGQYSWQREKSQIPLTFTSVFGVQTPNDEYEQLWNRYFVNIPQSQLPRYDLLGHDLMSELIHIVTGTVSNTPLQSTIIWQAETPEDGWFNSNTSLVEQRTRNKE